MFGMYGTICNFENVTTFDINSQGIEFHFLIKKLTRGRAINIYPTAHISKNSSVPIFNRERIPSAAQSQSGKPGLVMYKYIRNMTKKTTRKGRRA